MVVTLRTSLLGIFVTLFVVSMLTLFGVFYFHVSSLVQRAAFFIIDEESYAILNHLTTYLSPIEDASQFSAELIREKVLNVKNVEEIQHYLTHFLRRFPIVSGAYWGDEQGNFIYAHREDSGMIKIASLNRQAKPATETIVYRDRDDKTIKRMVTPSTLDPRTRPWYKNAKLKKTSIWTDVYPFFEDKTFGISISAPAFDQRGQLLGVFGTDVELDDLSRYVAAHKVRQQGEIFIVDDQGSVIASPHLLLSEKSQGPLTLGRVSKAYEAAFQHFQQRKENRFVFKEAGEDYIAAFKEIHLPTEHTWYIGIIDPEVDFTSPIRTFEYLYLLVESVIFILGILLISGFVTRIVRPIKKLVKETKKIKNFDLTSNGRVHSRIKEVVDLSNAIFSMKQGLRSFKRYVPASLVRQLIDTGQDVRAGGTKRELVIFFSDIVNFTSIAEKSDSAQLVEQVGHYFEKLSHIITEEKGTIDKYIGDAIMAFWGAPLFIEAPCQHAAKAALQCIRYVQHLNAKWLLANKPLFLTRIGLHVGDAIVGNIGSSERLNYTALGDTVNMTSRLVNTNAIYGTSILVTEPVYNQLKEGFILRFVDQVRFKGKAGSTTLYELLAEQNETIAFDPAAYHNLFIEAFTAYQQQQWEDAIGRFNACLDLYPQDTLAIVFIKRCMHFQESPPDPQWDGIWKFSRK